jgi:mannose-6-phosphate isomerase-like protein (cupin superfamily)
MRTKLGFAMIALLSAGPVLVAQNANEVMYWPKGVPPQGATYKADFGNHIVSLSHREVNGHVEVHQYMTDVMVIQSGEADLVTGGETVDQKTTGPGEMTGTSIKGGNKQHIGAGDVIRVPAGTPHQFFLAPGKQITYSVVKVKTEAKH